MIIDKAINNISFHVRFTKAEKLVFNIPLFHYESMMFNMNRYFVIFLSPVVKRKLYDFYKIEKLNVLYEFTLFM